MFINNYKKQLTQKIYCYLILFNISTLLIDIYSTEIKNQPINILEKKIETKDIFSAGIIQTDNTNKRLYCYHNQQYTLTVEPTFPITVFIKSRVSSLMPSQEDTLLLMNILLCKNIKRNDIDLTEVACQNDIPLFFTINEDKCTQETLCIECYKKNDSDIADLFCFNMCDSINSRYFAYSKKNNITILNTCIDESWLCQPAFIISPSSDLIISAFNFVETNIRIYLWTYCQPKNTTNICFIDTYQVNSNKLPEHENRLIIKSDDNFQNTELSKLCVNLRIIEKQLYGNLTHAQETITEMLKEQKLTLTGWYQATEITDNIPSISVIKVNHNSDIFGTTKALDHSTNNKQINEPNNTEKTLQKTVKNTTDESQTENNKSDKKNMKNDWHINTKTYFSITVCFLCICSLYLAFYYGN